VPFDPEKPWITSGIRLGTPAATTRGFGIAEFKATGEMIAEVLSAVAQSGDGEGCGARFSTFERVQLRELTMVKKDGAREPFDRTKLERSISIAARKRPVTTEQIDRLVSSIQRQLETSGESEIDATRVGEMVMDGLQRLDSVAYIRFASVYKDFREAKDFEDFAGSVNEMAKD
jgi:transcriptional repressor NrdR